MPELVLKVKSSKPGFCLCINTDLPTQGISAIYGPSGSGKTSLLRCIAGLEKGSQGQIIFNGEIWQNQEHKLPAHKRPIGYVFQEASLFEHLSAQGNLAFAQKRAPAGQLISHADAVELLGIGALLSRMPRQLSGGERQRVAIARALLINPKLLLMDEPLSSLDPARKQELLPYLERVKRELKTPIVYVTHSPEEIARLADHIVVLEKGGVVGAGAMPAALAQMDFPLQLGEDTSTIIEGAISGKDEQWQLAKVSLKNGDIWLRDKGHQNGENVRVRILARDVSLALSRPENTSILNCLQATVVEIKDDSIAGLTLVKLDVGGQSILARVSRRSAHTLALQTGQPLWAMVKSVALI